jgi:hypothetical protein
MSTAAVEAPTGRSAALAAHKRRLVEAGDEIAKSKKEWASQARGIWEAALAESEPKVLLNLLRYQYARNQKNWGKGVFERLEKEFETCIADAKDDAELALDLVRHLMVYTIRAYTYASKAQEEKKAGGAGGAKGEEP